MEERDVSTSIRWNPVRDMITMRAAMDRLMNDSVYRGREDRTQAWQLPVDAYTNDDAIVIVADVPGLNPEDVEVTLEGDTLTIRGELKNRNGEHSYLLRERASG